MSERISPQDETASLAEELNAKVQIVCEAALRLKAERDEARAELDVLREEVERLREIINQQGAALRRFGMPAREVAG